MQPQKPYMVRAFYDWVIDSNCTPHVLVDATVEGVVVPEEYVEDGEIVLNVAPTAIIGLDISNKEMTFEARFSGVPMHICVPIKAVMAVYANENGRGMVFSVDEDEEEEGSSDFSAGDDDGDDTPPTPPRGKPNLRIVK